MIFNPFRKAPIDQDIESQAAELRDLLSSEDLPAAFKTLCEECLKGSASEIPAYYDHKLLTIQFVEFPPAAEKALLQHNHIINLIYQSDAGLSGGAPFISVIDAIPGEGFNPLWLEVQITFTSGHTSRQLFSDVEVADAFEAGEITLESTGELYWCPVVGPK